MPNIKTQDRTVTILAGASVSDEIELEANPLTSFKRVFYVEPAADTEGTVLTFQKYSNTHGKFIDVHDGEGEYSVALTDDVCITLDPVIFSAFERIKVRTGTAASPTEQAANRLFGVGVRSI